MTGNMKIGNRTFTFGKKVYIMGILNVTPDSFSDGGKFDTLEHAMAQVEKMIEEGADLIDVGGESTRPGHQQITEGEEIARVVPVIQKIKEKYDIPVSIDTYKSRVAEAALEAGADMLNDIWGFLYDEKMAELAVRYDVPVCLMHNCNNTEYQVYSSEPLYSVNGVFNAISVTGNMLGEVMFYGAGAGKLPTASAVVADVVDATIHKDENVPVTWESEKLPIAPMEEMENAFFVRVAEADRSKITELFGDVTMIDAGIAGECGFITPVMKEKVFAEKAEKLTSMITRIRVNA